MKNTRVIIVYDGKAPLGAALNLCRHLISMGIHAPVIKAEDYEVDLPGSIIVIGHHDFSKRLIAQLGKRYNNYGMAYGYSNNLCVLTASRSALGRGKKGRKYFAEHYDTRISTHYEMATALEIPRSFGYRDKTRESQYDLLLLEFIRYGLNDFLDANRPVADNQENIAKEAAADLVRQMEADKDMVITLEDVLRNSYKQREEEGIKTLHRHLGENIDITALWRDAVDERELEEHELLDGELSAFTFRIGCYLIRSAQRLYKDTDETHYKERVPAERNSIAEYRENHMNINSIIERHGEDVRKVHEISAKHIKGGDDLSSDEWRFICLATTAKSWAWEESIDFIATVKCVASTPDEQAELFVLNTYVGSSFGVANWHRMAPDGTITSYDEHPYNPDSFNVSWKERR